MAEIPVTSKGPYTGPYNGPPYDGRVRHRPKHNFLNFILRTLTALGTAAAIVTMLLSNEHTTYRGVRLSSKWRSFQAFKWFIVANAVVFVYSVLGALVSLFSICARRGPLSYSPTAWLTFLFDFLLANALVSAASAALAIGWVGKHGVSAPPLQWTAVCDEVHKFCNRIEGAIIASFIAWLFLALSAAVAVSSLHNLGRRRN
ncbi:hypothetical protein BDL97_16G020300 [Sphagnum fallax]|jgi:uncharacterized protein (TIGR01569 family)|nr:hypothetical protein BDL97_16G020300 [Sphagnum fallax]